MNKDLLEAIKPIDAARASKTELTFTIEETTELVNSLVDEIKIDLAKFTDKGNKQAGKRVRKYTKSLETVGLHFRKLTV